MVKKAITWLKMKTWSFIKKTNIMNTRIPAEIALRASKNANGTTIFLNGTITEVSEKGICIEISPCRSCPGCQKRGIHPDCMFARYDGNQKESLSMNIYARIPETGKVIRIWGKALDTDKTEQQGFIRIRCTTNPLRIFKKIPGQKLQQSCTCFS